MASCGDAWHTCRSELCSALHPDRSIFFRTVGSTCTDKLSMRKFRRSNSATDGTKSRGCFNSTHMPICRSASWCAVIVGASNLLHKLCDMDRHAGVVSMQRGMRRRVRFTGDI